VSDIWRLDDQTVLKLLAAVRQGDPEVVSLVHRAVDRADMLIGDAAVYEPCLSG